MTSLKKNGYQLCIKLFISFVFFLTVANSAIADSAITGVFDENTLGPLPKAVFNITDPVKIYYEIHDQTENGDGYPLFLLHGGFANSQKWFNAKDALSHTYKVIAVDTRGHGQSEHITTPISYGMIANDLRALMWELGNDRNGHPAYYDPNEKVHVVGWSDGGIAAIDLCIKYPNAVNKAVFFGVNVTPDGLVDPDPTDNQIFFDTFLRGEGLTEDEWKAFRDNMWAMWMTDSYIWGSDQPFEELQQITAKTAVFAAKKDATSDSDNVVYLDHMKKIADSININKTKDSPNWCEYTELTGLVHGAPGNGLLSPNRPRNHVQADAFNDAVLKFLEP